LKVRIVSLFQSSAAAVRGTTTPVHAIAAITNTHLANFMFSVSSVEPALDANAPL
jgi:hypothetical protein